MAVEGTPVVVVVGAAVAVAVFLVGRFLGRSLGQWRMTAVVVADRWLSSRYRRFHPRSGRSLGQWSMTAPRRSR